MISGETLRAAEIIARLARSNDQAWGGLQIVAVGDFAQLPPVQSTGYSREKKLGLSGSKLEKIRIYSVCAK